MLPADTAVPHKGKTDDAANAARWIMKAAFATSAAFTSSSFHPSILPTEYGAAPQALALALWLVIIGASALVPRARPISLGTDFLLIVVFYAWAAGSVLWSNWSVDSALKSAALVTTTYGAFRLASRLPLRDIVAAIATGLFMLILASIAMIIVMPEIGIDQSWMHGGQWQGVFDSKQSLGFVASFAAFFALYRKLTGGSWLTFILVFGLSVATLAGSGSRGSAAVTVMSCSALLLCRASDGFVKALAVAPVLCIGLAFGLIMYMYATDLNHFLVFDTKVDLTERTFIWHYGIERIDHRLLAGFGLNGFWSDERLLQGFRDTHGWALDNFHSGYVTILVECGLIGLTLFLLVAIFFAARMMALTTTKSIPAPHCAAIACFVALSFQANITETMFLRSTSFVAILFVVFMFLSCHPMHVSERVLPAGVR